MTVGSNSERPEVIPSPGKARDFTQRQPRLSLDGGLSQLRGLVPSPVTAHRRPRGQCGTHLLSHYEHRRPVQSTCFFRSAVRDFLRRKVASSDCHLPLGFKNFCSLLFSRTCLQFPLPHEMWDTPSTPPWLTRSLKSCASPGGKDSNHRALPPFYSIFRMAHALGASQSMSEHDNFGAMMFRRPRISQSYPDVKFALCVFEVLDRMLSDGLLQPA